MKLEIKYRVTGSVFVSVDDSDGKLLIDTVNRVKADQWPYQVEDLPDLLRKEVVALVGIDVSSKSDVDVLSVRTKERT